MPTPGAPTPTPAPRHRTRGCYRPLRPAGSLLQKISRSPATPCGRGPTSDGGAAARNIEEVVHLAGRRTGTARDVASARPRTRCAAGRRRRQVARRRAVRRPAVQRLRLCSAAGRQGLVGPPQAAPLRWGVQPERDEQRTARTRRHRRPRSSTAASTSTATSPATAAAAAAGVDLELHDEDTKTDDQHYKGNAFHDRTWTRMV